MLAVLTRLLPALLLLFLNSSHAIVHTIQAQRYAIQQQPMLDSSRKLSQNDKTFSNQFTGSDPLNMLEGDPAYGAVKGVKGNAEMSKNTLVILVANITLGNPPQNLTAMLDFWSHSYFYVIGSDVTQWKKRGKTYNASASSTFVNSTTNFSDYYKWKYGQFGSDIVNIGGVSLNNVSIAVYNHMRYAGLYFGFRKPVLDAVVGLHPSNYNNTFVESIASQLDKPIISYWNNECAWNNKTAILTFGAEDSVNCNSDWVYADRKIPGSSIFAVDISSISASYANGSTVESFNSSGRLIVAPSAYSWIASKRIINLIVNATNAKWNSTTYTYVVDCDQVENGGSLVINIGNDSKVEKKVVLTGSDFIAKKKGICFLPYATFTPPFYWGEEWKRQDYLYIGQGLLGNHCVAKNIITKQYGFASSKIRQPPIELSR